ncbi:MAG TPA: YceI family protein [Bacteroidales bacterium]|nr:YceI family protein [Bacteroidales bacterium]
MFKKLLSVIFLLVLIQGATANTPVTYSSNGHEISILGNSNVQRWSAVVPRVNANADIVVNNGRIEAISRLQVEIDATAITGSEGNIMTNKIQETLSTRQNPRIIFRMNRVNGITHNGSEFNVNATGNLIIAGVTRPVEITAQGRVLPNGDIQISGVEELKMTSWQLEPPRAMLGALRTSDDFTVNFLITLRK